MTCTIFSEASSRPAMCKRQRVVQSSSKPECTIVADDFGISTARNEGIIKAMEEGVVTHASLMANGLAAEEAVALARERGLLDRLSLHLNLTEGHPLLGRHVPSLLSDAPKPCISCCGGEQLRGKLGFREACESGELCAAEAAAEARAQLRWFHERVGRPAYRVDGHQHCHVQPAVSRALAQTFAAAGVRQTRIPAERCPQSVLCALCGKVSREAAAARAVYAAASVSACAQSFVGLSLCGGAYSAGELLEALRAELARSGAAAVEVMVHPGYASPTTRASDAWDAFDAAAARENELAVLCDPAVRSALNTVVRLATRPTTKPPPAVRPWQPSLPPRAVSPPPSPPTNDHELGLVSEETEAAAAATAAAAEETAVAAAAAVEETVAAAEEVRLLVGAHELLVRAPTGVHHDPLNLPLTTHLQQAVRRGDRILYHGCGAGVLGLIALELGASAIHFADVDAAAVHAAAANAQRTHGECGGTWTAGRADLNDAPPADERTDGGPWDVILCNPPQMPGPPALELARPDKHGGADGLRFYRRLVVHAAARLRTGGRAVFMQTSFSSFAAVDTHFASLGFRVHTLGSQRRVAARAAVEELAAGEAAWLQALRDEGGASFSQADEGGEDQYVYEQRLAVATREDEQAAAGRM